MAEPDFAKGASPAPGYDTTPGGLGLSPAYLGGATATATGSGSSGSSVGWSDVPGTFAYSSADGPTGIVTTSTDLTGTISVGARIRLAQTTAKYFIVTAIDATTITMYGGTDYTLANAVITLPSYSLAKAPVGFNPTPAKWTQTLTDTSSRSQASPGTTTWYNPGALSLAIPIGAWVVEYEATITNTENITPNAQLITLRASLSTSASSESDNTMTCRVDPFVANDNVSAAVYALPVYRRGVILLAAKTSYFLIILGASGAGTTSIAIRGDWATTVVRAICAYL